MNNRPSQLGELPTDWARKKLGAITKVRQGLQIAISDRLTAPTSESKEYITIQSINKKDQAREYIHAPSKRVICNQDDVLMTRTGNTGIVVTGVDGVFHNNFFLIDFDRKLIDRSYLVEYLRTRRVQYLILTKAGTSTIPDLNHKDFYSIEFPVPPFLEQKKIAQILSTWDKAIATTEKLLEISQNQKQALMQQLLTGKKRFSGFNGVWEHKRISDICKIGAGQSAPQDEKYFTNGTHDFLRVSDIGAWPYKYAPSSKDKINDIAVKELNFQKIAKGSTLFTKSGASLLLNQRVLLEEDTFIVSHLGYAKPNDGVDSEFLYYQICDIDFNGLASGTSLPALQLSALSNIKVYVPKMQEQKKISGALSLADKEIQLLRGKLNLLKIEKRALMQQLLTGKKRVKLEG